MAYKNLGVIFKEARRDVNYPQSCHVCDTLMCGRRAGWCLLTLVSSLDHFGFYPRLAKHLPPATPTSKDIAATQHMQIQACAIFLPYKRNHSKFEEPFFDPRQDL
jgi:hypothetical protein